MRQELIISSLVRRVSLPANLAMVGLVGGVLCLFQLVAPGPGDSPVQLLLPFILLLGHLALAPVPWQWTGDDAARPGLGRGFVQALVLGLVWIGLVLAAMHLLSRPAFPPFPHPGPGMDFPHPGPDLAFPRPGPPGMPFPPGGPGPQSGLPFRPGGPGHRSGFPFQPGLGLGLVNLAFGIAFGWVFAQKEATEASERRTAELLRQAQARALQNQLEPHVLYNALNGLSELVHEDPLAAEEAIVKLADLYRMLTVHGDAGLIRLEQERLLVEAYLDMEQMRFGERLRVRWNWPDWADAVPVPPFFLLPLVENAIKHGISPADEGGDVVISCARQGTGLELRVDNTGRPLQAQGKGVGIANLEARLRLWTELTGTFKLEAHGAWTMAVVQWIPEAS